MLWKCWEILRDNYKFEQTLLEVLLKEHNLIELQAFNLQIWRMIKSITGFFQLFSLHFRKNMLKLQAKKSYFRV